jgi:hypothetical protein
MYGGIYSATRPYTKIGIVFSHQQSLNMGIVGQVSPFPRYPSPSLPLPPYLFPRRNPIQMVRMRGTRTKRWSLSKSLVFLRVSLQWKRLLEEMVFYIYITPLSPLPSPSLPSLPSLPSPLFPLFPLPSLFV